jgi:hypothetical protein
MIARINRTWENIKENIKTSAKESVSLHKLKELKPSFDEEHLGFLDQRKQAKLYCLQDRSQSNVDNMNSVRPEARSHFRNRKNAYLEAKIEELETNSKIKNIGDLYRGISDFKNGYQPKTGMVTGEKGDVVADSHSNLARWKNHFSQLLNIRGVNDVRQT